ncbi:thioredoxin domain-containing protein [Gardnerella sp. KA00288]|uniref:DsbA family protein n=1 Tax=Gardnerella sp. KA00288 TaxID=2749074 RepID=UPI003BAB7502
MPKIQIQDNQQGNSSSTRLERNIEKRERALREARERRQQTIIGIVVVLIVMAMVAAVGITTYQAFYQSPQANIERIQIERSNKAKNQLKKLGAKYKPEVVNSKGGILISKLGYNKPVAKAPTIATYFDPLCPGCGNFNREADRVLAAMVRAGQINLEIHPMSFLDKISTDKYSTRVSGAIAYIANNDSNPEHLLQFINNIFAKDFQPEEGDDYKPVSNEKLIEQAKKAGVNDSVASKAFDLQYVEWQNLINKYTPDFMELLNVSGSNKGSMTTPTVTINGKLLDINAASSKNMHTLEALLHCIGLDKKQVGVAGQMPKVSSTDSPIDL